MRIRHKLEGVDTEWQETSGVADVMRLSISFLDRDGNEVLHKDFEATGQSPGWTGSFETSPLQHRREQIVAPSKASSIWVVISSAGSPGMVGAYFVGNLTVRSQNPTNGPARELLRVDDTLSRETLGGWRRDGLRANMATVIEGEQGKMRSGLAIIDDDSKSHAQWNTLKGKGPKVNPLDLLVLEWDEMFSIAPATPATVSYKDLKPGFYRFRLNRLSLMGVSTEDEASLGFEVTAPFWQTAWFWFSAGSLMAGMILGGWRYQISRRLKLENARLAQQQVLENERFRIARDIHDDFGARVTQISLLSSAAQHKPGLSPETQAEFAAVSGMCRDLVGALYETVWAISPENDHLDSLATYLCQMANQMCSEAGLKCRLQIPELPHDVPITSSLRHNLAMTVKEAIHNIIKHAEATEVQVTVEFNGGSLAIEVKDNGKGFDATTRRRGNGLLNMERRMTASGGQYTQSSRPGEGTRVRLELQLTGNSATKHRDAPAA